MRDGAGKRQRGGKQRQGGGAKGGGHRLGGGWESGTAFPPDAPLDFSHPSRIARGHVVEAIQVEQTVHDVKCYFLVRAVAKFRRARPGGLGAGNDLAVGKGDHIGGVRAAP